MELYDIISCVQSGACLMHAIIFSAVKLAAMINLYDSIYMRCSVIYET